MTRTRMGWIGLLSTLATSPLAAQAPDSAQALADQARLEMSRSVGMDRAAATQAEKARALVDSLSAYLAGRTVTVEIPADSGWAWIEVRRPGQPTTRDSVWVRPKP